MMEKLKAVAMLCVIYYLIVGEWPWGNDEAAFQHTLSEVL